MAECLVVSGLASKRRELAGQVADLQRRITLLQGQLTHLDATIKLFSPDFELGTIKAKQVRKRNQYFPHGEAQRVLLDALRELGQPSRLIDIARLIARQRGFDDAAVPAIEHTLTGTVKRAEAAGTVQCAGQEDRANLWQLAPLPQ